MLRAGASLGIASTGKRARRACFSRFAALTGRLPHASRGSFFMSAMSQRPAGPASKQPLSQ